LAEKQKACFSEQPIRLPLQNDDPTLSFWEWGEAALVSENRRGRQEKFRFPKFFSGSTLVARRRP
jgi:hypothetical protein